MTIRFARNYCTQILDHMQQSCHSIFLHNYRFLLIALNSSINLSFVELKINAIFFFSRTSLWQCVYLLGMRGEL
jgi:hypothetical protein